MHLLRCALGLGVFEIRAGAVDYALQAVHRNGFGPGFDDGCRSRVEI